MKWSGPKDQGSRDFTDEELLKVQGLMDTCSGADRAVSIAEIARVTNLKSRTVRACLAYLDGREFILACRIMGVYVSSATGPEQRFYRAVWREDAEQYSAHLDRQISTVRARVERRRKMTDLLPDREPDLFHEP